MARARMYFALMVLAGVTGAWIEQDIHTHTLPVRPAAFYVLAIVPFGLVCLLLMLRAWDRADAQPTLPAQAAWPHDPDPTEALTRPMSDPYATRPYDPQADILTQVIDDGNDVLMSNGLPWDAPADMYVLDDRPESQRHLPAHYHWDDALQRYRVD